VLHGPPEEKEGLVKAPTLAFSLLLALALLAVGQKANAAPAAPALISPPSGASVTPPFTISWTAVSDPSGILGYNWQVSATSSFAKIARQDSTMGATQATVSGLAKGSYFWRVQAVNNDLVQGAWSAARSFSVTGPTPGSISTPSLNQPRGGNSFHPWELFGMSWSSVTGTSKYVLEASKDPTFPANGVVFRWESPSPSTTILITTADMGDYTARVFAVDANGNYSMPSNTISFGISFSAPLPSPPGIGAPVGAVTTTLPVTFRWNHVINPQPSGYEIQISRDSAFGSIEADLPQLNGPEYTVLSLTAGTKFWRIRSFQGMDSETTSAVTAWSQVGSFTIPSTPAAVASISLAHTSPFSGDQETGSVQLTSAAPSGGAAVSLTSSNPSAVPVPASVTVPAGTAFAQFSFQYGQVTTATPVTVTATLGSSSASFSLTLQPPSLKGISVTPSKITGGTTAGGFINLNGLAPAGGATIGLSSDSPLVSQPKFVTVPAGNAGVGFSIPTSTVSAPTTATVTATWQGVAFTAPITLTPQTPPSSLTLDPTTTTGFQGASGTVSLGSTTDTDVQIILSSSNPAVASVPQSVTVPAFAAAASFFVSTTPVSTTTTVTISASGAGVTKTATLTVTAAPPPPLGAPTRLAPVDGSRPAVGSTVTFDWSDVSGASSYQLQVSTSQTFDSTVLDQAVTASQYSTSVLPASHHFGSRASQAAARSWSDLHRRPGTWSGL